MNIGKRQESGVRSQKVNISFPSPHVLIFLSSQSPVPSHQSPVTSPQSPVTSPQSPVTSHQSPVY
ncbi:hypothetical protein IQ227_00700 [Anabaena aphanizomenioides LEGE 00250]|uniref:Uncharacterized protein n=1 Tax=Sphaerospermopsis aphanizomenoides LEGE 00250 TaxID=2777972 RepID=A0ABR9V8U1_9CYAN|nr:hypothetical protein [Sphaerospermopsis aphanizomenoides LEGE 00250]